MAHTFNFWTHIYGRGQSLKTIIAELQRPKAAMRSPIPIEPVHSFALCIRAYVRTTTTTSHNMAAVLQLIGQPRHAALVYSVHL